MTFSGIPIRPGDPEFKNPPPGPLVNMHAVLLNELEEVQGRLSRALELVIGASDQSMTAELREMLLFTLAPIFKENPDG